jgi:hypothetical protein
LTVQLKGISNELEHGSNGKSFARSCYKDILLGYFFQISSSRLLVRGVKPFSGL